MGRNDDAHAGPVTIVGDLKISGKVGVNNTNPLTSVHITSPAGAMQTPPTFAANFDVLLLDGQAFSIMQILTDATGSGQIQFSDTTRNVGAMVYDHADDSLSFRTNGVANRMKIDGSGNVTVVEDIRTTAWTTFTSTIVGWADPLATSSLVNYKKVGTLVFIQFYLDGVSDTTAVTFTLPFTQIDGAGDGIELKVAIQVADNSGAMAAGLLVLGADSDVANCFADMAGAAWTASGNKRVQGQFWYVAQ